MQPVYGLYISSLGPSGSLGLPTSQEFVLPNGDHRQTFEGGVMQYTPGGGAPVIRPPVFSVQLSGVPSTGTLTLNLGQSVTLTATPRSPAGDPLTDRAISWTTTNSRVVTITAGTNGTAVAKAVGGGAASLAASSEGKTSQKVNVIVISPCCQIGDGAPPLVQQSFKDALTRNQIAVQAPIPSPATRAGSGYMQIVQSADAGGATFLVAESDKVGSAFVVGGAVLAAWQSLGGAVGALGYPVSDLSAGGTQRFENGAALAGNPVRLVSGGILTKWGLLGYETGAAGSPVSDAAVFSTFGANSGSAQAFTGGAIYSATAGPRAGQTYFVSGLILQRYNALGGPGGDYGMPASDEFVSGGTHQQNFEGGNITWSPGDAAAKEHAAPKTPGLIVSPATVPAGSRARFAIVGFPENSTIRVSMAGRPDFTLTTANGAYTWDMFLPLGTKSGVMAVHAADTKGTSAADATLTVRGFNDNRVPFAIVQGDNQTGPPGALLPLALRVALRDAAGDPVVGAAVTFEASSGAQLSTASALTDSAGQAETQVRLQNAEGVTLVRADAPGVAFNPVTFGLRSAAASLSNFPKFQQAGDSRIGAGAATIAQKGALLTAVAAILRYHQNRGELGSPNGFGGSRGAQSVPHRLLSHRCEGRPELRRIPGGLRWRRAGGQSVACGRIHRRCRCGDSAAAPAAIADWLAQGSPVLLSLAMSLNGAPAGGHFVVATGIDCRRLHCDSGSQPAVCPHQPVGLPYRVQCRGKRVEGRCARHRPLRPAQSRIHALPAGGALPTCRADAGARHGYQFRGRRLRAAIRTLRFGGCGRATPAAGPLLSRLTACDGSAVVLSIVNRRRAALPCPSYRLSARRVAHRPFGQAHRSLTGLPARSSISRLRRRTSVLQLLRWSMGPRSSPDWRRAEWRPSSARDFPVLVRRLRPIWIMSPCPSCSPRRSRLMRSYRRRWHQACILCGFSLHTDLRSSL